MQQTTMLAIFAIALALGLTTAMFVVPMMPQAFADQGNRDNACDKYGGPRYASPAPFCGL